MATPDENEIIKIIDEEGGESTVRKIAIKMGLARDYCRVIIHSMGRNDLVDVFRNGTIRIGKRGWSGLGKEPKRYDGLKRYQEDQAKWKNL